MEDISDLASKCIRCGFCLESCPTFQLTSDESQSPRGRIYLAKALLEAQTRLTDDQRKPFDTCVGCRACETACPSGVEFGKILEATRSQFQKQVPLRSTWKKRLMLEGMSRPAILSFQLGLLSLLPENRLPAFLARLLFGSGARVQVPKYSPLQCEETVPESSLPPIRGEVALLGGCAMSAVFEDVHASTIRLARRLGYKTRVVDGCCGALHAHNGFLEKGEVMKARVLDQVNDSQVLLTNSAGCGCWLKENLPSKPVLDVTEFFENQGLSELIRHAPGLARPTKIAYHEACHLVHGQKISRAPRYLLEAIPNGEIVPVRNSLSCCGSGGIYNLLQPKLSDSMGQIKANDLLESGAHVVATGNPGCLLWIAEHLAESGRKVQVLHTVSVLESAFVNPNLY